MGASGEGVGFWRGQFRVGGHNPLHLRADHNVARAIEWEAPVIFASRAAAFLVCAR